MQLILTKNKLFSGFLLFGLITTLLVLFDVQYFYLRAIFSFIFLTTIPGLLIMLMLRIRKIGLWEYLVYTIGLSISFLMFGGLAINWVLPWLNITDKPLFLAPLLVSFGTILSAFGLIAYKRNKNISLKISLPKLNWLNKAFFIAPIIFPILSILGATTLNNGGPNYLTMIMLGGIATYVFLIVLFRDKLNEHVYPWSILTIALSLLLMFSLRSWYISGWDVFQEYQVFTLTKAAYLWVNLKDTYNSCLSITLLPTIYSSFINGNDMYIFKFFFQVLFAFLPVIVYLITKKMLNKIWGFLSAFFFISQFQFIIYSSWIRQEIALLSFAMLFMVMIEKKITRNTQKLLFIIFLITMVLSHYSTTYLALVLILSTYFIILVFKITFNIKPFSSIYIKFKIRHKSRKKNKFDFFISAKIVIIMILTMIIWYSQITQTSNNIIDFSEKSLKNISKIFDSKTRASRLSLFDQFNIFFQNDLNITLMAKNYYATVGMNYQNNKSFNLYPEKTYKNYDLRLITPEIVPFKIDYSLASKLYLLGEIDKKMMKVFIIIGLLYMLSAFRKGFINNEYIIISNISLLILILLTIIPFATINYNMVRAYQQFLIILSTATVIGALTIFNRISRKYGIYFVVFTFIIFFLHISGFIPEIIGGNEGNFQLNNTGVIYNGIYTHDSEILSLTWLSEHYNKKNFVYAGYIAKSKLLAFDKFSSRNIFEDIIPKVIDKNSYVYSSYTNTVLNIGTLYSEDYLQKAEINYNFPTEFLNQNKNLLYNNGESRIYK